MVQIIAGRSRGETRTGELRGFGRSGTPISPLTLGTMNFGEGTGGPPGAPTGADEAIRIIHAALDAGITAIDTADVYSQGESEQVVGRAFVERDAGAIVPSVEFAELRRR